MANEKKLDERIKKIIQEQGFLYRGTNSLNFRDCQSRGIYCGRKSLYPPELVTCTSLDLFNAMWNGVHRCSTSFYKKEMATPVLISINIENYLESMRAGLESGSGEIEIIGEIDFKEITVLDNLDSLLKVCPNVSEEYLIYFRLNYLKSRGVDE